MENNDLNRRFCKTVSLNEAMTELFNTFEKIKNKKSLSDHAQKVSDCIKSIEKELKNHNFKAYDKLFNQKIVNISISKNSSKYGLKTSNIKMIFEGRFEIEKPKRAK